MRFVEEITPPPEEYSTGTDPGENGEDRKRRRYRKGRFLCLLGAVMIILAVTVGNRQMTMKPETTEIEAASVETVPAAMETGSFETKTGTEAETETANEAESVTAPPETLPSISDTETKTDKSAKETETAAETKATKAADPQTQATQQTFSPTQGTKTESVTEESLLSSEQASSEEASSEETLSEEASEEETLEEESSEGETSEEESPEEENPEEESPEGESNSYGYAADLSGRTNGPTAPYESEPETPSLYEE